MVYDELEDRKGITKLSEIGGTASKCFSAFDGLIIRESSDGEKIFYQHFYEDKYEPIHETSVEYYTPSDHILDTLNMDEEEFEDYYGGSVAGFEIDGEIHLIDEFLRDDYGR